MDRRQLVLGLAAGACNGATTLAWAQEPDAQGHDDRVVVDPATQRRIRVRLRLPASDAPAPLILYSPGLGGGLSNGAAWCEAWRRAGFVVATMGHPVSGDAVFDTARRGLRANMALALAGQQYPARIGDTKFIIRQGLATLGIEKRVDAGRIGIAGHSYGAIITQLLTEEASLQKTNLVQAAVALSPGVANLASAQRAAVIRMPFFCVTGDQDNYVTFSKGGESQRVGAPLANRLAVYRALPPGAKQLLYLASADHMTFAGEPLDRRQFSRDVPASPQDDARAWARVSAATTAFWQRYLMARTGPETPRADYLAAVKKHLDPRDKLEAG